MKIECNGDIVPGYRIGSIELGMRKADIDYIFSSHTNEFPNYFLYEGGDIRVWVKKSDNIVSQILAYGNFDGKFMGRFGIGSFISDIEKHLNAFSINKNGVYIFEGVRGICFELKDIDEDWDSEVWFKTNASIEAISVFREEGE